VRACVQAGPGGHQQRALRPRRQDAGVHRRRRLRHGRPVEDRQGAAPEAEPRRRLEGVAPRVQGAGGAGVPAHPRPRGPAPRVPGGRARHARPPQLPLRGRQGLRLGRLHAAPDRQRPVAAHGRRPPQGGAAQGLPRGARRRRGLRQPDVVVLPVLGVVLRLLQEDLAHLVLRRRLPLLRQPYHVPHLRPRRRLPPRQKMRRLHGRRRLLGRLVELQERQQVGSHSGRRRRRGPAAAPGAHGRRLGRPLGEGQHQRHMVRQVARFLVLEHQQGLRLPESVATGAAKDNQEAAGAATVPGFRRLFTALIARSMNTAILFFSRLTIDLTGLLL
jgi:hypothetical protein